MIKEIIGSNEKLPGAEDKDKWTESDEEPLITKTVIKDNTDSKQIDEKYLCIECFEDYYATTKKDDWIKCDICQKWFHEGCTLYGSTCNICGREQLRIKHLSAVQSRCGISPN